MCIEIKIIKYNKNSFIIYVVIRYNKSPLNVMDESI